MASPKPKPTNLKLLEGNPGKRPLNQNEPKPKPVAPKCPHWLSKEAKREWKRIAPELELLGLLTIVDKAALAGYCQAWARWREAEEFLKENGSVYPIRNSDTVDDNGNIVKGSIKYLQQVPQVGIANQCMKQIRGFCSDFGMTPSSRSQISLPSQTKEDELDRLLG